MQLWRVLLLLLAFMLSDVALAEHKRPIFRCETADGLVFSDKPCSVDAKPYEAVAAVNVYSEPARAVPPREGKRKARSRRAAPDVQGQQHACSRLQRSLSDIRARMRAGYAAREGERLRERQRRLEDQRRKTCRGGRG